MNKKELFDFKQQYQEKFNYLCEQFLENHNSQAYLKKTDTFSRPINYKCMA